MSITGLCCWFMTSAVSFLCRRTPGSSQVLPATAKLRQNSAFLCSWVRAVEPTARAEAQGSGACTPATSSDAVGSLLAAAVESHTPSGSQCESPLLPSLGNVVVSDF